MSGRLIKRTLRHQRLLGTPRLVPNDLVWYVDLEDGADVGMV